MNLFRVYEIRLKVIVLEDLPYERSYTVLSDYIDNCLAQNVKYMKLHETNQFKYYCFDQPYPTEKDGIYKKNNVYTVRIRSVDEELIDYLAGNIANHHNQQIKGQSRSINLILRKFITDIYTVTPAVIKNSGKGSKAYWKNDMSFEQFEERLKVNLVKKFNQMLGIKIDENFDLYNKIELVNRKPIAVPYKGIKLLGDKICISAADNENAQNLMYLAVGCGIGEMNSRGFGFVNYKYL